jgi:hypothetical protein
MKVALKLVRCDRCGLKLYAKPHGITVGDGCGAQQVGEFMPATQGGGWQLVTICLGRFRAV